jgi:hypothetical protein
LKGNLEDDKRTKRLNRAHIEVEEILKCIEGKIKKIIKLQINQSWDRLSIYGK